MESKRIVWVDLAKGFTMILVIAGHTIISNPIIRGCIFSFHMPLFFIVSGYTSKKMQKKENIIKLIKSLISAVILPTIIISLIQFIAQYFIENEGAQVNEYISHRLLSYVFCSGAEGDFLTIHFPALGIYWFMVAYVASRVIYGTLELFMSDNHRTVVSCLFLLFGVIISRYAWLPLSFDLILVAVFFIDVGKNLKRIDFYNLKYSLICFIVWTVSLIMSMGISRSYFEMAQRCYPLFPICIIGAVAGTILSFNIAKYITRFIKIKKALVFIGKNTNILFFIHALDKIFLRTIIKSGMNEFVICCIRIAIDVGILCIIDRIKKEWSKRVRT